MDLDRVAVVGDTIFAVNEQNICRVCLESTDEFISTTGDDGLNVDEILSRHFAFRMEEKLLSICQKCWIQIECFDRFYLKIEELYRNYCWPENVFAESINAQWSDIAVVIPENKESKTELSLNICDNSLNDFAGVPLEVKEYNDKNESEDDFFDGGCDMEFSYDEKPIIDNRVVTHASTSASTSTKISIEDNIGTGSSDQEDSDEDDAPLTTRRKTYKKCVKRKTLKTKKAKKKSDEEDEDYLPENDEDSAECKRPKAKKNSNVFIRPVAADIDYTDIKKIFTMNCDICKDPLDSLLDAQNHYKDSHKQRGYLKCCNKKFSSAKMMLDHVKYHNDPDLYKCVECDKRFLDSYALSGHRDRMHIEDTAKPFICDKCPHRYASKGVLNAHKKKIHNRVVQQVECPQCGKTLSSTLSLTLHIRLTHNREGETICDLCGTKCSSQSSYENHYKVMHTTLEKVQCPLCQRWFKHQRVLNKHMYVHTAEPETCTHCGKTLSNKLSLASHIRFVHGEENKHKCTTCGRGFKKLLRLKEHVTIHTGQRDIYKCEFCPKAFRFQSAKYAHRKKTHPKEVEEYFAANKKYRY